MQAKSRNVGKNTRNRKSEGIRLCLFASLIGWLLSAALPALAAPCNCQHASPAVSGKYASGRNNSESALYYMVAEDPKPAPPFRGTASSTTLEGGAQSNMLEGGTQSTTLQGGTSSTMLQTGTQSTLLQTGTQSTLIQGGAQTAMIQGQVEREGGPVNVLFLIDASYSMKEKLGGADQKIDAAKQVLQNALSRIPTDVNLGLRVFGQGLANDPSIDCTQSALLVPIGQGNRRAIIEQVRQIKPFGLTPLTYALMQSEHDLRSVRGQKNLILITDGAETCGGNPCQYVRRLNEIGIKVKVDIVGLGLKRDRDARNQLNCIAEVSGGKYYDANTAAELIESVSRSVSKAISGRVLTRGARGETPPDLVPIERMLK